MATVKELVEQIRPAQMGIEQDGEVFISYDELMSDYQDYESIMDKDEFASDAGYDMVRARKQYRVMGNIEDLFTDDRDILFYRILREEINTAIGYLPQHQQYIINHRFGLNDSELKSQSELAHELGLTVSQVSYAERAALRRLRKFEKIKALGKK